METLSFGSVRSPSKASAQRILIIGKFHFLYQFRICNLLSIPHDIHIIGISVMQLDVTFYCHIYKLRFQFHTEAHTI